MHSLDSPSLRIAYVVSRFPSSSETFIFRELNAVDADSRFETRLLSLFPPKETFAHEDALKWLGRVRRPGVSRAATALAYWLIRSPRTLARTLADLVTATWRSPSILARSLVLVPVAAAHARALVEDPVDHVHAHFATYPALAALLISRLAGPGYSFTAHAHDIFVDDTLLRLCLREASFVVAISRFNRDFIERRRRGSSPPVEIVHSGIDLSAYQFNPREVPAQGPVRALCVASLQEHKGHTVLLDALASARDGLGRIEIDLVGAGPLRAQLEEQARKLGIAERVRFLGPRTEREVVALLEQADLFVLPSTLAANGQMEGLPVALIEAAASGVPTVASRLSGIPELIDDGVTGHLAEPGDSDSLAQAIATCLDPRSHLDLDAARERVEREFTISGSARRLGELFDAHRCRPQA